jgi:mono/diheme cytochrome c family protein
MGSPMAAISKRSQFLLWTAAAAAAIALLVVTVIGGHLSSGPQHATFLTGSPAKGSELFYGKKHCSLCHAVNGSGGGVAPDLGSTHPGTPAMGWLITVIWNHMPGMWRQLHGEKLQLNQEEMANILAFLYQAGSADKPGDLAAGQKVFETKGCVRCHTVRTNGPAAAPDLARVAAAGDRLAWMRAMWNHAQFMIEPVKTQIGDWPEFTGAEMNDLVAYVNGNPTPAAQEDATLRGSAYHGWDVFQDKCIQCHSVRGKGGRIGPELGPDHELPQTSAQFAAVLWNHAPSMVRHAREAGLAPPTLQGQEITDVLRFLASLRYFEPTGSPFLGERVFAERGCARCHGPAAKGTRNAPELRAGPDAFTLVSFATALWKHGPAMNTRAEKLGIPWPSLEPGDVGELISFLNDPERKK